LIKSINSKKEKMTPIEFKNLWTNESNPLSPISLSRLECYDFSKTTIDFLHIAGLPIYPEPNLSFAIDSDEIIAGLYKLTEIYDIEEEKENNEKYVVIGSCHDGNPIAIDTKDNDKIVELDPYQLEIPLYFNRNISTLAGFLVLYRDFEVEVLIGKDPTDNFQTFNFTDEQLNDLKTKMFKIDPSAITEDGFWKEEFDIMLSIREERFGLKYLGD
jgi:hypothetical protein